MVMALRRPFSYYSISSFFMTLLYFLNISEQLPVLSSLEQDSVYKVLESVNPDISWRTLFPDDLCTSAPHGIVCDYFFEFPNSTDPDSAHITEMSFGYVSDYTANPPCSPNSTLNPLLFSSSSFKYLRKLFFYKCFTGKPFNVHIPGNESPSFESSLEELVLVDNPSLVGSLNRLLGNYSNIRRIIVTGNGVYGTIPETVSDFVHLQEITLSRNQLRGQLPASLSRLRKLKVLDLSRNYFDGNAPESIGNLTELLKLDLNSNRITGKIPESFRDLKKLEFLDLSFNRFGNFGIPEFLPMMQRLKEVYLSGNLLGGQIPDQTWENLENISRIGFSNMGLTGRIPSSMGMHLRNLNYLGLDNNKLEGNVPEEFKLLECLQEINLENNSLSGRVPFSANLSAKMGSKLRLGGNPELCVDKELKSVKNGSILGHLNLCPQPNSENPSLLSGYSSSNSTSAMFDSTNSLLLIGVFWIFWVRF